MSKTAFILSMGAAPAAEVVAAGKKQKMVFNEAYVYSVRSKSAKKAEGKSDVPKAASKRVRPARVKETAGIEKLRTLVLDIGRDRTQEIANKVLETAQEFIGENEKENTLTTLLCELIAKSISDAVNSI